MTATLTSQSMQSALADEVSNVPKKSEPEASKEPSNFLHDGEKTVNPWTRSEKQIVGDRNDVGTSTEFIQRDPRDPWNYVNRANSYLQLMKSKEALKDANAALALKPTGKELLQSVYCIRGQALLQLKQYKPALDDLNKASALDSENGDAVYFRGMAKEKLGQLPQAIKDYELARSLKFSPIGTEIDMSDYMKKLSHRIKINWHPPRLKTTKKAVAVFMVLRDGKAIHIKIERTSGIAAADAAAISAIKEAAPFEPLPQGAPRYVNIMFSFDYNVHGSGGISFLEQVTEKWDNAEADALKKLSNAKNGKDETAIVDAELKLAKIYTDRGRYSQAIELYQSALQVLEKKPEQQPVYGKTFGRLAMVYSLQGKTAESETEFKKSLEIVDKNFGTAEAPNDLEVAEILKEYAKVLYKTKKVDEANKIYARLKKGIAN